MVHAIMLCFLRFYVVALVPWLPHVFPGSDLSIPSAHVVFERSSDGGWDNLSGTISDGRGGLLE